MHELSEGVNLYVHRTDKFKTNTVFVFIHQNLAAELATKTALLPMVLKRGTEAHPTTAELNRHLDWLYGAEIQTGILKMGERQIISVRLEMPNSKYLPNRHARCSCGGKVAEDLLVEGFRTLGQVVFRPAREGNGLRKSYVTQEKANLKRQIDSIINEKSEYASIRLFEEMCKGERYGVSRLGKIDDIEAVDAVSLAQYHEEILSENPLDIFFVGNVEPASVVHIAQSVLLDQGTRSDSPIRIPPADVHVTPEEVRAIREAQDINQAKLVMGFRTGMSMADEGFWALKFYNGVLGMFPHSRLFQNVREKHSLAYYIYSRIEATKGLLTIGSGIDEQAFEQVVRITRQEMEELAEGRISNEEMDFTLKGFVNRIKSREDAPSSKILNILEGRINGVALSASEEIRRLTDITKEEVARAGQRIALDTIYFLSKTGDQGAQRISLASTSPASEVAKSPVKKNGFGGSDQKSGVIESPALSEALYWRALPCGMKAYVLPKPSYLKKHATFATNFGSIDSKFSLPETGETVEVPAGVAHFLEHKVFEEEDGNAFDKFAAWGASSNAYTTNDYTTYLFSTTENFELCLRYLLKFVQSLYLTPENVEKEKGIIEQEVRMYEDMPQFKVHANLMRALFHEHPVRIEIGGTVESVKSITKETLETCYRTFYHPSNMVAFIVGDVDPETTFGMIEDEIGRICEVAGKGDSIHNPVKRLYPEEPPFPKDRRVTHEMVVSQPIMNIGFKDSLISETGWGALMREIATSFALEIVLGKGSDLYQSLYEEGLINQRFSMGYGAGKGYGVSILSAETPDPERLEERIMEGLKKHASDGLKESDFMREQRKAVGQFLGVFNQPEEVAQYFNEYYFRGIYPFDYMEALTKISFDQVQERFIEHLASDNYAVSVILPK